ncbi:MAG TPA: hypothetical protein VFV38_31400 [Ktedonobacteraceae bacterium]|nr:hypothetical protein [Ktedonobacteraceae bacterium]
MMNNTWLIALKRRITGLLWKLGLPVPSHRLSVPMSGPASRRLTGRVSSEEERGTSQGPSLYDLQQAAKQRQEERNLAQLRAELQQD